MADQKLEERNIPGMMNRSSRFAEVEYAENIGATLKRIVTYFIRERVMVIAMLAVVIFGTLCGVYAPSLQSKAIDIIAGSSAGKLAYTLILMLIDYLLYSGCQLLQGLLSAKLSQRIVRQMRGELFGKIIDLPIPLAITIHVQPLDKAASVAFVKRRIAWMDKEIIDEQMSAVKKGYDFQILPSELKYS